jgi:hypothetical protein
VDHSAGPDDMGKIKLLTLREVELRPLGYMLPRLTLYDVTGMNTEPAKEFSRAVGIRVIRKGGTDLPPHSTMRAAPLA